MDPLLITVLAAAGLLVGATGTWSPCGLSMIETIGPIGHTGGARTTLAACATFAPFALLGGAITFGLLALVGDGLGAGGTAAYIAAAAVAVVAAVAEARGVPIVPQVRRQLPVGWRTRMPMPVAAAGYGVLLGLGFTTFILSYGVWALMGIALAVGDPLAGLIIGAAFGAGRAIPIVVLAPIADRRSGRRACDAMMMRPGMYRGARAGDALALALAAAVLVGSAGAEASRKEVAKAADPDAVGTAVAFERSSGEAALQRSDGAVEKLPGSDPGIGGDWVASIDGRRVRIHDRGSLEQAGSLRAAGADGLAVSQDWIAYRQRRAGKDKLKVARLSSAGTPRGSRVIARAKGSSQLSRPALDGRKLVVSVSHRKRSKLVRYRLGAGRIKPKTLIASKDAAVAGPSIAGRSIAYVLTTKKRQTVRIKGLGRGKGRSVYRRGKAPPTLWTTAIAGGRVWITVVKRNGSSKLISVGR